MERYSHGHAIPLKERLPEDREKVKRASKKRKSERGRRASTAAQTLGEGHAVFEDVKKLAEKVTGIGRPKAKDVRALLRARKANLHAFRDDGETPNNPTLPLIHYRSPVELDEAYDPAAIFEELFAANGWTGAWRDGVYDFLHFHTRTHEVLGIARGHAGIQFGGKRGRVIAVRAGDVIVVPAGTGHRRKSASRDLLVVGAYPKNGAAAA
jgi:uncharacterized protein YjlB